MNTDRAGVAELARRVLAEHLPELATELADLILATVPHYAQATRGDLEASCRANLARSLQSLSGDLAADEDLLDAPAHTARIRAQQGVPLDSLLASYRLGGRALWQRLLREARAQHEGLDAEPLLDVATAVWLVIEEHSAAVSRAYRAEQELLHSQGLRREQVLLDALLDDDADPAAAQQAAVLLGLPPQGGLLVVVAAYEPANPEPLRNPQETLAALGISSWWRVRANQEIGVVALPAAGPTTAVQALRSCATGRAGLSPVVTGPAALAAAFRLAVVALASLPREHVGIAELSARLPEALLVSSPELARQLRQQVLGPVLRLSEHQQKVLLETLTALLAAGGSPTQAAPALYCHRNTVIKRLQRIEVLTGLSIAVPRDRLVLELATLAHALPAT